MEDRILAEGLSIQDACQTVAPKLGVSWHTARQWVQHSHREGRVHRLEEGTIAENARLRRENLELRDTNELINNHRWKDVLEVEIAAFEWVNWWNRIRLNQALDYRTPVEVENDYWHITDVSEKK